MRNFDKIISQNKYLTKFRKISFAKLITQRNFKDQKCFAKFQQNHLAKQVFDKIVHNLIRETNYWIKFIEI